MANRFSKLILLGLLSALMGCSLYQSRGRKLLQSNADHYAGIAASENVKSCGPVEDELAWQELKGSDELLVFQAEQDNQYELQIADSTLSRSCVFSFSSAQERSDRISSAVELTHLHFSLGQFAFSHKIPLKYQ